MIAPDSTPCTRPVMRYYGGKWRIAPAIVALMPSHEVYVEPFGGAASVLLQKPRVTCEVYNDLYAEVVNVFRMLRDRGPELRAACEMTPYARDEYSLAYQPTEDTLEAARRFIFRSTAGIGSNSSYKRNGFRTSLCDVKHATATSWANLPPHLEAITARLKGVIIENREAERVCRQYDAAHTLHYLDPPYLAATRSDNTRGYQHELRHLEEHENLLAWVLQLKGKVMLSGYDHPLYEQALPGWHKHSIQARAQSNRPRTEVLWMNYQPHQPTDFRLQ